MTIDNRAVSGRVDQIYMSLTAMRDDLEAADKALQQACTAYGNALAQINELSSLVRPTQDAQQEAPGPQSAPPDPPGKAEPARVMRGAQGPRVVCCTRFLAQPPGGAGKPLAAARLPSGVSGSKGLEVRLAACVGRDGGTLPEMPAFLVRRIGKDPEEWTIRGTKREG